MKFRLHIFTPLERMCLTGFFIIFLVVMFTMLGCDYGVFEDVDTNQSDNSATVEGDSPEQGQAGNEEEGDNSNQQGDEGPGQETYSISGAVTGYADISKVIVLLQDHPFSDDSEENPQFAQIDEFGQYVLSGLPDGTYYIIALEDRDGDGSYENDNCVGVYGAINQPIELNSDDAEGINMNIVCS